MKPERISRKIRKKFATKKIIDRLTYSPIKDKQKKVRKMRQELQRKAIPPVRPTPPEPNTLKFGSFNIQGLSIETGWTVQQLLTKRGFDVSVVPIYSY